MKKIICLMLAAMFLVSTAFAENTTTEFGEWRVSAYVDEFEIPTGKYCAVIFPEGTFDNSAANDAFLGVKITCEYYEKYKDYIFGFTLYEYGNHMATNTSTKYNKDFNVVMLDSLGQKHYLAGAQAPQSYIILFLEPGDNKTIFDAFMQGGTVRFYIEETERPINNYSFTIEDCGGFDKVIERMNSK